MVSSLIRTRECPACGAYIASNSAICPYCDTEQPEYDRIPSEIYNELIELIQKIERGLYGYTLMRKTQYLSFLSSILILILPVACSITLQLIFKNWILSGIFLACAVMVSTIRIKSNGTYFITCQILEKRKWKHKLKPGLKKYLKQHNLDISAYYEVLLDFLHKESYTRQTNLNITFDELEE